MALTIGTLLSSQGTAAHHKKDLSIRLGGNPPTVPFFRCLSTRWGRLGIPAPRAHAAAAGIRLRGRGVRGSRPRDRPPTVSATPYRAARRNVTSARRADANPPKRGVSGRRCACGSRAADATRATLLSQDPAEGRSAQGAISTPAMARFPRRRTSQRPCRKSACSGTASGSVTRVLLT